MIKVTGISVDAAEMISKAVDAVRFRIVPLMSNHSAGQLLVRRMLETTLRAKPTDGTGAAVRKLQVFEGVLHNELPSIRGCLTAP